MARARSRRGRGRRRRGKRSNSNMFFIRTPVIYQIKEGEEQKLKFNDIFPKSTASFFTSVPWRLLSAQIECCVVNKSSSDPAICQFAFHTGTTTNVEFVSWTRFMVGPGSPRSRTLRMARPNLWKEEETKDQLLASVKNCGQGSETNNTISGIINFRFQFNGQPYPSKNGNFDIPIFHGSSVPQAAMPQRAGSFEMIQG